VESVLEGLDVFEHQGLELVLAGKDFVSNGANLEGFGERLHHRVVVATTCGAHAREHPQVQTRPQNTIQYRGTHYSTYAQSPNRRHHAERYLRKKSFFYQVIVHHAQNSRIVIEIENEPAMPTAFERE